MMNRDSFIFYAKWAESIRKLPPDIRLDIYESVIEYATSGNIRKSKAMARLAFDFIKADLDRDYEKYISVIERNKENGLRGGRKRLNPENPLGYLGTQPNPKNLDNDNDYDIDCDYDIKKESTNVDKKETRVSSCSPEYEKFLEWLKENAPFCANTKNFPKQITETELGKLKDKYSGKQIADIIEQIENRKDLRKRYTNLYRTILNWAKKEYESK